MDTRSVNLRAEPCECTDTCQEMCDTLPECVNFIARQGDVFTMRCDNCKSITWHLDLKCLRCEPPLTEGCHR